MQPDTKPEPGFDGVPKGMPQIQQRTHTLLFLVLPHDGRLHPAAHLHRMCQRCLVARQQGRHLLFAPFEKRQVVDQPVLVDLGQPGGKFTRRQRVQHVQICQHHPGLPEGTDHVLAGRMIDGRLAADRRVHLRQQGRRNLHKRRTALPAGSSKTGHVSDHPAAQCHQRRLTLGTHGNQGIKNAVERLPVLVRFAVRQDDHFGAHASRLQ